MLLFKTATALKSHLVTLYEKGSLGLVPTMGALHKGHTTLVERAAQENEYVVVSIFVNPTQFGPNEDLDAYPRQLAEDSAMLKQEGVALLWAPAVEEMYPDGFASNITVSGVSSGFCGGDRPGHFDGVATVVSKLFLQSRADVACFGQKDYQQLLLVSRLSRDLDIETEVVGCPTVREADGLAMSSRNVRLSATQRAIAPVLKAEMDRAAEAIRRGADRRVVLDSAKQQIENAGYDTVEYLELRDAETLAPVTDLSRPTRLLAAAMLGDVRLIDNIAV